MYPMARVTLNAINDELNRRGHNARLEKASGYFYFFGGDATDWIDRTVPGTTVSALTLRQWIEEFKRVKTVNAAKADSIWGEEMTIEISSDEYTVLLFLVQSGVEQMAKGLKRRTEEESVSSEDQDSMNLAINLHTKLVKIGREAGVLLIKP